MQQELDLDALQIDCLKEWVNMAMGDGAKALATFTGRFVVMSVPRVTETPLAQLPQDCQHLQGDNGLCVAHYFSCLQQQGAILLLVSHPHLQRFAALTDSELTDASDAEGLAQQLAGLLHPIIVPRLAKAMQLPIVTQALQCAPIQAGQPLALPHLETGYNLCFCYACESQTHGGKTLELGIDVIIRAPFAVVQSLSDILAARFAS